MRQNIRITLLAVATLLMIFAALINAAINVPHLHEDMVEIGVRPTLLSAIMLFMHFSTFAFIAFALIVLVSAVQSARGFRIHKLPLAIIGLTYIVFGVFAFASTWSHHALGYVLMGALILGAVITEDNTQQSRA